jgi:hypothetical protein
MDEAEETEEEEEEEEEEEGIAAADEDKEREAAVLSRSRKASQPAVRSSVSHLVWARKFFDLPAAAEAVEAEEEGAEGSVGVSSTGGVSVKSCKIWARSLADRRGRTRPRKCRVSTTI